MKIAVLDEVIHYDGTQINPLWGFDQGVKGDSVIVFRGSMDVSEIKDAEDAKLGLAIAGSDLIHFIVERFASPASIREAYYMQRMLVVCIQDELREHGVIAQRSGDDLFVDGGKLTVSIATASVSSLKMHVGINLTSVGTPDDVETIGLSELDISDWEDFGRSVAEHFAREVIDIDGDITKTRCLY